jgi:Spy/CpxP family protein refolding chaperone
MMMGGGYGPMGMMGGYGYGPLGMLELTDKQRELITAIHRDQRKQQMELMEKMMDEMDKIRQLMLADKRDPSEIGKAYEPVFILQRRMIENMVETMNKVEGVLTKEQKAELKKYRERGMGYGMMGY